MNIIEKIIIWMVCIITVPVTSGFIVYKYRKVTNKQEASYYAVATYRYIKISLILCLISTGIFAYALFINETLYYCCLYILVSLFFSLVTALVIDIWFRFKLYKRFFKNK